MTTTNVEIVPPQEPVGPTPTVGSPADAPQLPWWKRGGWVTALTSILSLTVPVTTAVWGLIQRDRELVAKKADQEREIAIKLLEEKHHIQMDFLALMKNDDERLRTLRLVEATSDDPTMKEWARNERKVIDKPLQDVQSKLDGQTAKAAAAEDALKAAQADNRHQASTIDALRANMDRQFNQLSELQQERKKVLAARSAYSLPEADELFGAGNWSPLDSSISIDYISDRAQCDSFVSDCIKTKAATTFEKRVCSAAGDECRINIEEKHHVVATVGRRGSSPLIVKVKPQ